MTGSLPLDDLTRWRLILGEAADGACGSAGCTLSGAALAICCAVS